MKREEVLLTSDEWKNRIALNMKILDHDGWDRKNFIHSYYVEKITQAEFEKRMSLSTIRYNP